MSDEERDDVSCRLRARDSDDLLAILRRHDLGEWQPEVFEIGRSLLLERGIDVDAALAAPVPEAPSPPQTDELTVVATFATLVDAEPCRSALTAAGLDVFLLDENAIAVDPALWPALGGVKMAVPNSQADETRAFLTAAGRGDLSAGPEVAIQCPRCASFRVSFVRRTNRTETAALAIFSGVVSRTGGGCYVCDDCGASIP